MKDLIRKWSLEKVQFIFEHVEDFIENDTKEIREAAKSFEARRDLDGVQSLVEGDPSHPRMAQMVFERLSLYFDVGLLIQKGPGGENANWWVTDCLWKGNVFHLEMKDQIAAAAVIPEMTPLQVHRADAKKVFKALGLEFFLKDIDGEAYLVRPTPHTAYLLVSQLPKPWSASHLETAHRLINKSFIF
jgi:hypothetical protein